MKKLSNKLCKLIPAVVAALLLTSCGKTYLIDKTAQVKFDIDFPVGQITKDVTVEQDFVSNADTITQIRVYGATYKRENTATVIIRLLRSPADAPQDVLPERSAMIPVMEWTIDSSEMKDNKIIKLDVDPGEDNAGLNGIRCLIEITSPDGEPELSPTFWMTEEDVYPDGHLVLNGYEQYNDLWFQVVGR